MASLTATTSYACQGTQGVLTLDSVSDAPGAPAGGTYSWLVVYQATNTDYGGPVAAGDSVNVPDGEYQVRVYANYPDGSAASSTPHTYQVTCSGGGGSPCTLALTVLSLDAPTTAGGWGQVSYHVAGATNAQQYLAVVRDSDGAAVAQATPGGDGDYVLAVPPAGVGVLLHLTLAADAVIGPNTCTSGITATVPAYVAPVDPSLTDPARWEPVGGVLPNPVLLLVEAVLLDGQGQPRPGLHVEVELLRFGAATAFASFQATVRTASQLVDAAPYLRAELVAAQRYAATLSAPVLDTDAGLRFTYRYRVVDRTGAGPWVARAGQRWAVLAALPAADDTLAPYVADGTGRVASLFPDGEAVQAVGYPLEVMVLLPPNPLGLDRYAELRYLDSYGQEVEIRAVALGLFAEGVLRIPLPPDPLPCAASVQVSLRDDDRAYVGTCGGTVPPTPTVPGAILTETGRLLR